MSKDNVTLREPLQAVYDRFKHLDGVFEMVDHAEDGNHFPVVARDLWRAIKAGLGHTANKKVEAPK